MSSIEKIILYNDQKIKLSIPKSFQEFKELCIQTFYISKKRSENMIFQYYDENNNQVTVNDKTFGKDECKKSKLWKLSINEDLNGGDTEELEKIKQECIYRKSEMLREAQLYKQKLFEECKKIIEFKIKEQNEKYQEDLKKIKENYNNSLKNFKSEVDNQTNNCLGEILKNVMNKYLEKVKLVDEGIKSKLNEKIDELIVDATKSFEDINLKEKAIGILIEHFKTNLNAITKDKIENLPFLIDDIIIKDVDSLNENFSIKFNVFNQNAENNKDEFYLEITPKFKSKLDLADINKGEIKTISINLEKSIEKDFKKSDFTLKILNKDGQAISNDLKLTFKLNKPNNMGTFDDLFG